ncbi:MAG: ACP S-malonyltransferase [Actinomycetota bacterium]
MRLGVFPGQGVSAGEVLPALERGHPILEKANEVLCFDLRRRVEVATRAVTPMTTSLAQPAIFVASVAGWDRFQNEGGGVGMLAGHSLGEYAALVAGGAVSFAQALCVVKVRGDAMERAAKASAGGMAAILGLDLEDVEALAVESGVAVANDNAPAHVVVSGPEEGLARIATVSKERGARCIRIEVRGAFHTPAMSSAETALRDALDHVSIRMPRVPVVSNVSARPYRAPGEIRKLLVSQVGGRVRFRESLAWAKESGVDSFEDLGPGQVAGRMTKRNLAVSGVGAGV